MTQTEKNNLRNKCILDIVENNDTKGMLKLNSDILSDVLLLIKWKALCPFNIHQNAELNVTAWLYHFDNYINGYVYEYFLYDPDSDSKLNSGKIVCGYTKVEINKIIKDSYFSLKPMFIFVFHLIREYLPIYAKRFKYYHFLIFAELNDTELCLLYINNEKTSTNDYFNSMLAVKIMSILNYNYDFAVEFISKNYIKYDLGFDEIGENLTLDDTFIISLDTIKEKGKQYFIDLSKNNEQLIHLINVCKIWD